MKNKVSNLFNKKIVITLNKEEYSRYYQCKKSMLNDQKQFMETTDEEFSKNILMIHIEDYESLILSNNTCAKKQSFNTKNLSLDFKNTDFSILLRIYKHCATVEELGIKTFNDFVARLAMIKAFDIAQGMIDGTAMANES